MTEIHIIGTEIIQEASEAITYVGSTILLAWQDGIIMMISGVQECSAVKKAANYWGALGYKTSGTLMYGGYFTSSTTGTGKKLNSTVAEGIGAGAWGDLMGADIHGGIYGMFVEGNNVWDILKRTHLFKPAGNPVAGCR